MKTLREVLFIGGLIIGLAACGGKGASQDTGDDDGGGTQVASPVINHQGANGKSTPCKPGQTDGIIGVYNGYVVIQGKKPGDQKYIPLSLEVASRQGSSGTGTPLRASLRVGVLAGVTVGTDDVAYDSNGNFSATFANSSSAGGNSAELFGAVQCGQFVTATIRGRNVYSNIVLSTSQKSLFDNRQIFNYQINVTKKVKVGKQTKIMPNKQASAVGLSITSRLTATPSNQTSDLPLIPDLTAALAFSGFPNFPNTADTTVYEALEGHLEIGFSKYSVMKFESVGLTSLTGDTQAPVLKGVLVGSTDMAGVELDPIADGSNTSSNQAPQYYTGIFQPSGGLPFSVIANFVYENKTGTNPPDSLFPTFPQMNLQLSACGSANAREVMELVSINPLTSQAVFTYTNSTTGEVFEFDATFTAGFKSLSGKIFSVLEASQNNNDKLNLKTTGSSNPVACSN